MLAPWLTLAVWLTLVLGLTPAFGATPTLLGAYGDWTAYTRTEGGEKLCYMTSSPKSKAPRGVRRGDVSLLVTQWPARDIRNQISIITGYTYKADSKVKATIGAKKFDLFPARDRAWLFTDTDDEDMLRAMIRGSRLMVQGTSSRNTNTTDRYSLSGVTAANKAIAAACAK